MAREDRTKLQKSRRLSFINQTFEKKSSCNRLLRASREKKLEVLYKLGKLTSLDSFFFLVHGFQGLNGIF